MDAEAPLTPEERELFDRYHRAAHQMQSAIAFKLEAGLSKDTNAKSLRVGVNAAIVDSSALGWLLVKKGLITRKEYLGALTEWMEREAKTHADEVRKATKNPHLNFL